MTNLILKGHKKPLYPKKSDYTKDDLQLEFYRETYFDLIKKYKQQQVDINSVLRKIRLCNLLEHIKRERNKYRTRKHDHKYAKPKVKIKSDIDLKRKKWLEARQIGNTFSKMNKFHKTETRQRCVPKKVNISPYKENKMQKAKAIGNIWSLLNVIKIRLPRNNAREELLKKRQSTFEYGTYNSLRNKLSLKDTLGEFDSEYQKLLQKCVQFEKDHLNICGFLEEKLYASYQAQLNAEYKNNNTQTDVFVKNVSIGVQVDMDAENPFPKEEVHWTESEPFIFISSDPESEVSICTTNIENTFINTSKDDGATNPQNNEGASKRDQMSEELLNFTETVESIGQSFEDAVLNITAKGKDTDNDKMRLILSDLFLAFGLSLVKSVVGPDIFNEDIKMEALKDQSEIYSCLLKKP